MEPSSRGPASNVTLLARGPANCTSRSTRPRPPPPTAGTRAACGRRRPGLREANPHHHQRRVARQPPPPHGPFLPQLDLEPDNARQLRAHRTQTPAAPLGQPQLAVRQVFEQLGELTPVVQALPPTAALLDLPYHAATAPTSQTCSGCGRSPGTASTCATASARPSPSPRPPPHRSHTPSASSPSSPPTSPTGLPRVLRDGHQGMQLRPYQRMPNASRATRRWSHNVDARRRALSTQAPSLTASSWTSSPSPPTVIVSMCLRGTSR